MTEIKNPSIYNVGNIQYLLTQGPDYISKQLRDGKSWDAYLIHKLQLFLQQMENPVFVDIGANLGSTTIPIGKFLQKKNGTVHCIEAQRGIYYQLCGNIFLNQLTENCFAYNLAISNENGIIDIPILDFNKETNIGALSINADIRKEQKSVTTITDKFEPISLRTLDDLNLPPASILNLDIEGMELEAFQGGVNYLRKSNFPPLFFGFWGDYMKNQIPKRERLFAFLKDDLDYECYSYGESCIAQHKDNKFFDIQKGDNNALIFNLLK